MRTGLKIMDIKKDINANMWIPIHDIHSGVNDCYMRIQEVAKILCIDKGEIEKCYKQHLLAEQYTKITSDEKWSESVFGAEVGFNYSAVEILMELFNINNDLMKEALKQSYNLQRYNCYMD